MLQILHSHFPGQRVMEARFQKVALRPINSVTMGNAINDQSNIYNYIISYLLVVHFIPKSLFNHIINLPVILILDMEAESVEYGLLLLHLDSSTNNTSG